MEIPKTADFDKALNPSPQDAEKYLDKVNLTSSVEMQQSSREPSLDYEGENQAFSEHGIENPIPELNYSPAKETEPHLVIHEEYSEQEDHVSPVSS